MLGSNPRNYTIDELRAAIQRYHREHIAPNMPAAVVAAVEAELNPTSANVVSLSTKRAEKAADVFARRMCEMMAREFGVSPSDSSLEKFRAVFLTAAADRRAVQHQEMQQ